MRDVASSQVTCDTVRPVPVATTPRHTKILRRILRRSRAQLPDYAPGAPIPDRHLGDAIPSLTDGILGQCPDRARSVAPCSGRLPRPSGRDTDVGVFPMPSTSATASVI